MFRIALARAAGNAAEAILEKLNESGLAPDSLVLLDEESRRGTRLPYGDGYLRVEDQDLFDFSDCAVLLLPIADEALVQRAISCGCLVASHELPSDLPPVFIDGSNEAPSIPYNTERLRLLGPEIACVLPTLQLLDRTLGLRRASLVLLRSAEFHGKAGVEELAAQTISLLNAREAQTSIFPAQLAFNVLPQQTDPQLQADLDQFLGNISYPSRLQSVNVPLFHGFVASLQLELASETSLEEVRAHLEGLENGVVAEGLASPITDCNQSFSCVISQLEQVPDQPASLQFWIIADPMRYGLANNYVNVTDFLLKSFL